MNQGIIWLIIAFLGILFVVKFLFLKGKTKKKTDYHLLFKLGVIFLIPGIIELIRYGESMFFILGIIYIAIGFYKKREWRKK